MAEVNTVKVISDSSDYETAKAQIETAIQAQENLKVLADLQRLPEEASSETREYCRKIIREADSQIERLKNKYSKTEKITIINGLIDHIANQYSSDKFNVDKSIPIGMAVVFEQ